MEELFVRPSAQVRMHEGPLGQHIDLFINTLNDKGYARDSRRRAAWLVSDFSRWLLRRRILATGITLECVDAFLRCRKRRRTPRWEDRPMLGLLLTHLANSGVIATTTTTCGLTPAQQLEADYVTYMLRERNLAPATILSNRMDAGRLLASLFADGAATFENITAQNVIAHITRATRTYPGTGAASGIR